MTRLTPTGMQRLVAIENDAARIQRFRVLTGRPPTPAESSWLVRRWVPGTVI